MPGLSLLWATVVSLTHMDVENSYTEVVMVNNVYIDTSFFFTSKINVSCVCAEIVTIKIDI